MSVNDIGFVDFAIAVLFGFSGYALIKARGWKKGGVYFSILLLIGALLAVVSTYFDDLGKYIAAALILFLGLFFRGK